MHNTSSFSETSTLTGGSQHAVIKVIGIGGGGNNTVDHMQKQGIKGVEFICANTDAQVLQKFQNCKIFQLGEERARGLGAGANPEKGREAAEIARKRIRNLLEGADMIFITAGEGGGTGSGASPVFAEVAHELGILTVAVVTKPFSFEGKKRLATAEEGIRQLSQFVDSLITIPNNKLMRVFGEQVSLIEAFEAVNNVLLGAVQGIAELITRPGLINVDFADVKAVMSEMGTSMMGTGEASGEGRAKIAAKAAMNNDLLEDIHLAGARGVLVNITGSKNLSIREFAEVGEVVKGFTSEDANIVVGTVIDPDLRDTLRVTVVLTGLGRSPNTDNHPNEPTPPIGINKEQLFDRPAILRKKNPAYASNDSNADNNYLDVLNFVRREKRNEDE